MSIFNNLFNNIYIYIIYYYYYYKCIIGVGIGTGTHEFPTPPRSLERLPESSTQTGRSSERIGSRRGPRPSLRIVWLIFIIKLCSAKQKFFSGFNICKIITVTIIINRLHKRVVTRQYWAGHSDVQNLNYLIIILENT